MTTFSRIFNIKLRIGQIPRLAGSRSNRCGLTSERQGLLEESARKASGVRLLFSPKVIPPAECERRSKTAKRKTLARFIHASPALSPWTAEELAALGLCPTKYWRYGSARRQWRFG